MPTDSAPMVIALGEAYTGGDKGLPQNAVAARKWFRVGAAGYKLMRSSHETWNSSQDPPWELRRNQRKRRTCDEE